MSGCAFLDESLGGSLENAPLRARETMDPPAAQAPAMVAAVAEPTPGGAAATSSTGTGPAVAAPAPSPGVVPAVVATVAPVPSSPANRPPIAATLPPSTRAPTTCVRCSADSYSPIPADEPPRAASALVPLLASLRSCLDRVGAQAINPIVLVRFTPDGEITNIRVDAGGYDNLGCIREAASARPAIKLSRGTTLRCEYTCPASK